MTSFHSLDPSIVTEIGKLRKRSYRSLKGCVIVEGYPEVKQAVDAGVPIEALFISPPVFKRDPEEFKSFSPQFISQDDFAQIAFGSRLKGILAICKPKIRHLNDLQFRRPDPLVVVLENVEKPGNLGAVIRSCDGAGCDAIIVCDGKTDIYNQHVVRSSIGTLFSMPIASASCTETYRYLKANNFNVVGATVFASQAHYRTDLRQATALIFGNEHNGLSEFWRQNADELVKISMLGTGRCLNIAMSASIMVYEAHRQRQQSTKREDAWRKQAHDTFLSKQKMNATN